jgi:hypothetical protein
VFVLLFGLQEYCTQTSRLTATINQVRPAWGEVIVDTDAVEPLPRKKNPRVYCMWMLQR